MSPARGEGSEDGTDQKVEGICSFQQAEVKDGEQVPKKAPSGKPHQRHLPLEHQEFDNYLLKLHHPDTDLPPRMDMWPTSNIDITPFKNVNVNDTKNQLDPEEEKWAEWDGLTLTDLEALIDDAEKDLQDGSPDRRVQSGGGTVMSLDQEDELCNQETAEMGMKTPKEPKKIQRRNPGDWENVDPGMDAFINGHVIDVTHILWLREPPAKWLPQHAKPNYESCSSQLGKALQDW
ncbi:uncharacterized protein EI90DRAFT_3023036 [Cantharellus anzutake]|uniref:uncharacterized protein n=1 Tax=Cantharellus anzutake TaxID=1750568 RepID=UPI0019055509|nr:uncharacterized protein EI90DRAFT_3023036 [Cantharellus anzutake]KAF8312420.1 hypothetical protein EI90DRAFT_3023036 [Cantharellus anzutake]